MKLIAEFGVNWLNDQIYIKMLDECKKLGISMVKLQLFRAETVQEELRAMYIDSGRASAYHLAGERRGIDVFFTPMYPEAIDICERIGVKYYKVKYYDRNNLSLYRKLKKIKNKTIFISTQDPKDTIFFNMAKYQKRIQFLYCIPKYPAKVEDYVDRLWKPDLKHFRGLSDHTSNLNLFKIANESAWCEYFEMHMKLDDNCYEKDWSKSFEELKEVLK